jgi:DNA (cytosine-5)-methyltransferase 1
MRKRNVTNGLHHVDLFAGCGGLSLGLEQAGFHPVFVNELNPDAMSTYLANRAHVEPRLAQEGFNENDIKQMVRPGYLKALGRRLKDGFGIKPGELDLVAGGPPCQGFSGIGHRRSYSVHKEQLPSNYLFEDMLYVISELRPRAFLFENVKGLLSAKWTPEGEKGEIWKEIRETYERGLGEKYVIRWALVRAKDYGVPQNRPRVLMVGMRRDLGVKLDESPDAVAGGLLPRPTNNYPDLIELLGDLVDKRYENGGRTIRYPREAANDVQALMRSGPNGHPVRKKGDALTDHEYSFHAPHVLQKFEHMLRNDGEIPDHLVTKKFAQRVLKPKWGSEGPTITATSLPDDYVHFSQPRVLTVREWARLQMFPDWYEFKGKRTTGGVRRAGNPRENIFDREVPKYTQIGNAVPVGLAAAVGSHLRRLLGR